MYWSYHFAWIFMEEITQILTVDSYNLSSSSGLKLSWDERVLCSLLLDDEAFIR